MAEHTHVGVYGILVEDGRILLILKSRGPYAGKLDLPGGRIDDGENEEDGLRRELLEETGISVKTAELLRTETRTTVYFQDEQNMSMNHIGILYRVIAYDATGFNPDIKLEDVSGAGWYGIKDLALDQLTPFAQSAVKELLADT